jgi:hypothetical protein
MISTAVQKEDCFMRPVHRIDHQAWIFPDLDRLIDGLSVCRFFIGMLSVIFPRFSELCVKIRIRTFDKACILDAPHHRHRNFCAKTQ